MTTDNQQPSEMEAIEEQAHQRPRATEAIEDITESTNENDTKETYETGERTQDHDDTNSDISNDARGNNDEAEEFEQAMIMSNNLQIMKE